MLRRLLVTGVPNYPGGLRSWLSVALRPFSLLVQGDTPYEAIRSQSYMQLVYGIVPSMTTETGREIAIEAAGAMLRVVDAVRAWRQANPFAQLYDQHGLAAALEELDAVIEPRQGWVPVTWADVVRYGPGTRVRLGGIEATVRHAEVMDWHVDPRSPARYPRPLEHQLVNVKLTDRDTVYRFDPAGRVEVFDMLDPAAPGAEVAVLAAAVARTRALRLLAEGLQATPMEPVAHTTDEGVG